VCFTLGGTTYRYVTNVLDARLLSLHDLARLYARRWDIELAFKLLKCELGLRLWWGTRPELVMIQLWLALILAQLLHALQLHIANQAHVEPFGVSLHVLLDLQPTGPTPILERLLQSGRTLGLIRPSSRLQVVVPTAPTRMPAPLPNLTARMRHARYAQRNPHPRAAPFVSRFSTQLLL
jgi:Transposase DDE domain